MASNLQQLMDEKGDVVEALALQPLTGRLTSLTVREADDDRSLAPHRRGGHGSPGAPDEVARMSADDERAGCVVCHWHSRSRRTAAEAMTGRAPATAAACAMEPHRSSIGQDCVDNLGARHTSGHR